MKTIWRKSAVLSLLILLSLYHSSSSAAPAKHPNIVLILCDDLGFETMSTYGGSSYKTPNIDALAATGLRFKRAYCTPLCSPSRVELMTGRYGFRTSWTNLIGRGGDEANDYFDPLKEKTFGHILKQGGYATALAGKWQLAEFPKHPDHVRECGFDEYCCWAWQIDGKQTPRYWDPAIWQNGKLRNDTEGKYGEDIFSDFLIDFMSRHKDAPFFVYYPMTLVHDPHLPTPDSKDLSNKTKGKRKKKDAGTDAGNFPDMVAYTDKMVGKVVAAIDKLGLRENTIIIFTGDNGTARTVNSIWNGQTIRGGKGTVTEFGTHVPLIANWKGTTPSGKTSDDLVDFSDVVPTLAELGGTKLPGNIKFDGRSFAPQLRGEKGRAREWIFSQLGHEKLVRDSRYMLHSDGRMYDVENDPLEHDDLSGKTKSEIVEAQKRLQGAISAMK
jgi:arylsulfatase A